MPPDNLHMTTLEIMHSKTAPEVEELISRLGEGVTKIVNYTNSHRTRLYKPLISFDTAGLALSFLPVVGASGGNETHQEYTYHHLRRDVFDIARGLGASMESRYTVPSAHLTIARFITQDGFLTDSTREDGDSKLDHQQVKNFIDKVEKINGWLEANYWPRVDGSFEAGGDWIVGEEKGLEYRKGTLWYGGGERVMLGKGFERIIP